MKTPESSQPVLEKESAPRAALFARRSALWWLLMGLIFAVGLAVRLYDLAAPPVDFHPVRQLHSALIARGMYYENHPGIPEWQRELAVSQWRTEGLIEPPVFERLTAWTYNLLGSADLRAPRLYAVLFWMIAAVFVTLLAVEFAGRGGALAAALVFLIWPYGVIASRAFQPEPLMIALITAALWAAVQWSRRGAGWGWTIAAGLLAGAAVYSKSVAVFFLVPPLAVIVLSRCGWRAALRSPRVWTMAALAVIPYAVYHINGVYLQGYLVDQFSLRFFPEMWLDPAFYLRWISNLGRVFPFELLLVALLGAFMLRQPARRALLLAGFGGYFLYGMTLSHHISTHDYYHLPFFPLMAWGLAGAAESLFHNVRGPRWLAQAAVSLVLVAALVLNGYEARTAIKRSGAREQAQAWQEIGQSLEPGASVAALVPDYGVGLKYYAWINPQVWPTAADVQFRESVGQSFDFAEFFSEQVAGRDFFVVTMLDELDRQPELKELLLSEYALHREAEGFLIFDLRAPGAGQGAE